MSGLKPGLQLKSSSHWIGALHPWSRLQRRWQRMLNDSNGVFAAPVALAGSFWSIARVLAEVLVLVSLLVQGLSVPVRSSTFEPFRRAVAPAAITAAVRVPAMRGHSIVANAIAAAPPIIPPFVRMAETTQSAAAIFMAERSQLQRITETTIDGKRKGKGHLIKARRSLANAWAACLAEVVHGRFVRRGVLQIQEHGAVAKARRCKAEVMHPDAFIRLATLISWHSPG